MIEEIGVGSIATTEIGCRNGTVEAFIDGSKQCVEMGFNEADILFFLLIFAVCFVIAAIIWKRVRKKNDFETKNVNNNTIGRV